MKDVPLSMKKAVRLLVIIFLLLLSGNYAISNTFSYSTSAQKDSILTSLENSHLAKATQQAVEYLAQVQNTNDDETYIEALDLLFQCYQRQGDYERLLVTLRKQLATITQLPHSRKELTVKYYLGLLYMNLQDASNASHYFIEALKILDQKTIPQLTEQQRSVSRYQIYTNLGIVLLQVDKEKMLDYLYQARKEALMITDSLYLADSYLNIGWAHLEMNDYAPAKTYLDSAATLYIDFQSVGGQAKVYLELGLIYLEEGQEGQALEAYLNAHELLFDAFDKEQKYFTNYYLKHTTLEALSKAYHLKRDWDLAMKYANAYYDLVKKYKDNRHIANSAQIIAELYEAQQEESQALRFIKISNEYQKKLEKANTKVEVLKREQAYQLNKQEHIISDLVSKTKAKDNALLVIIFLSSCLGLFVIMLGKRIKENKQKDEAKIKAKEELLKVKAQSIANLSLINQSKNQLLQRLKGKLQSIYQKSPDKPAELKKLIFHLKASANEEEDWERFHHSFTEVNPSFYQKIQENQSKLTNLDVRHCALIRLNLSNKDAARLLGISPKSVQMARYRLKKKLQLEADACLKEWIAQL